MNQIPDARTQAELILNQMTVEEKVGQLFLVTFQGTDMSPTSQIYDLVVNRHVGGVILSIENNNHSHSGGHPPLFVFIQYRSAKFKV